MDVQEIRRENVRRIMKERGYNKSKLAEVLERSQPMISQYFGDSPTREVGDELARHVERCFGLPPMSIDTPHTSAPLFRVADPKNEYANSKEDSLTENLGYTENIYGTLLDLADLKSEIKARLKKVEDNINISCAIIIDDALRVERDNHSYIIDDNIDEVMEVGRSLAIIRLVDEKGDNPVFSGADAKYTVLVACAELREDARGRRYSLFADKNAARPHSWIMRTRKKNDPSVFVAVVLDNELKETFFILRADIYQPPTLGASGIIQKKDRWILNGNIDITELKNVASLDKVAEITERIKPV